MIREPTPFPLPELAQSMSSLRGVGPATAQALAARGLRTMGHGLFFFPLRYEDRRRPTAIKDLKPDEVAVVRGKVSSSGLLGKRGKVYRIVVADQSGRLNCLWFRFKKPYLEGFEKGADIFCVGAASLAKGGGVQMVHPELYPAEEVTPGHQAVGRIMPVYPELNGISPGRVRKFMAEMIEKVAGGLPDPLHGMLPTEIYPMSVGQALGLAHLPRADAPAGDLDPEQSPWRRALALNELFYFELGLALKRTRREASPAEPLDPPGELLSKFIKSLPFELTKGQKKAVACIKADMARPWPMGRLLGGDVGTGKTVVAACAALLAAEAGAQAAFMAPTEVLARQHFDSLGKYLKPLGVEAVLATGSLNGSERKQVRVAAAAGASLIVGTHALLSGDMSFKNLGLAIIDEQHRFGVQQRLTLAAKGRNPHLLVLSATPIPRTLALALAGHLDIGDLPERPVAVRPVDTTVLAFDQRRRALEAMSAALSRGEHIYVICPLVEESQIIDAQDAQKTHRRLSEYFKDVGVGLLHGRLDGAGQQEALEAFKTGRTRILVATTVVEVGVDVPQATLMVVLGAERFGLSQLHQLRGRVGRGEKPGMCLLVAGPEPGDLARERLEVLAKTHDGMAVAEADLHLRGPGEALGARQAGLPPFKVARWSKDAETAPGLRKIIADWLAEDPGLASKRFAPIREECLRRWGGLLGLAGAG